MRRAVEVARARSRCGEGVSGQRRLARTSGNFRANRRGNNSSRQLPARKVPLAVQRIPPPAPPGATTHPHRARVRPHLRTYLRALNFRDSDLRSCPGEEPVRRGCVGAEAVCENEWKFSCEPSRKQIARETHCTKSSTRGATHSTALTAGCHDTPSPRPRSPL